MVFLNNMQVVLSHVCIGSCMSSAMFTYKICFDCHSFAQLTWGTELRNLARKSVHFEIAYDANDFCEAGSEYLTI